MGKDTEFVIMAKLCLVLIFTDDVLLKGVGYPILPYKESHMLLMKDRRLKHG